MNQREIPSHIKTINQSGIQYNKNILMFYRQTKISIHEAQTSNRCQSETVLIFP